jgi:uncharacterized protein (UPF0335 family)
MAPPKKNAPSSREMLRSFKDRIVRHETEKAEIAADIKDVYTEAKSAGFDPKALRKIVKEAMQTQKQRAAARETEALVDAWTKNSPTRSRPSPQRLGGPGLPRAT